MDQKHREHLQKLLQLNRARLRALEEQRAAFGLSTPPEVTTEIDDVRAEVMRLESILQQTQVVQQSSTAIRSQMQLGLKAMELPKIFDGIWEYAREFVSEGEFYNSSRIYKEALEKDYAFLQILGMEQPVPLDDIYTEVHFVNRIKARMYRTAEELEQEARQFVYNRSTTEIETRLRKEIKDQMIANSYKVLVEEIHQNFKPYYDDLIIEEQKGIEDLDTWRDAILKQLDQDSYLDISESLRQDIQESIKRYYSESIERLRHYIQIRKRDFELKEKENLKKSGLRKLSDDQLFARIRRDHKTYYDDLATEEQKGIEDLDTWKEESLRQIRQDRVLLSDSLRQDLSRAVERYYAEKLDILRRQFQLKKSELRSRERKMMRQAQQDVSSNELSADQLYELDTQLSVELEREIEKEIHQELNNIIANDFEQSTKPSSSQLPASQAIAGIDRVIILGRPGAGKTTFLKHILLRNLRGFEDVLKFPIFVTLKEFADSSCKDILDFIVETFDVCGFADARNFTERILRSRQPCLLLFDGLDEVPRSLQQNIIRQVIRMSKKYRQNQFVISCRTASYQGQLEGFTEVEIADFSSEQVARFVNNWFRDNQRTSIDFLKELKRHPGLQELTTTPLLLALLCITYKRNQKLPDQKSLLYLSCIDALFVDWDSSRQIRRESFVEKFDVESKKHLLGKVACDTFCDNILFFSRSEILSRFNESSVELPIEANSGKNILEEFVQHHGLLLERAKDIYSFSHLTFHEFFTALHLSRGHSVEVLERLCDEIWKEEKWKEVAVFLGGLLTRADVFLVCLRNRMKEGVKQLGTRNFLYNIEISESAIKYALQRRSIGEDQMAWEIWFRCKMCEYKLHKASYGSINQSLVTQLSLRPLANLVVKIFELDTKFAHDLTQDRPLNRVLKECFTKLQVEKNIHDDDVNIIVNYFRVSSILLEILASRVRVAPDIKVQLLDDLFRPSTTVWDYPTPANRNRLGA